MKSQWLAPAPRPVFSQSSAVTGDLSVPGPVACTATIGLREHFGSSENMQGLQYPHIYDSFYRASERKQWYKRVFGMNEDIRKFFMSSYPRNMGVELVHDAKDAKQPTSASEDKIPADSDVIELGVWRLFLNRSATWQFPGMQSLHLLYGSSVLWRYLSDVYSLSPFLSISLLILEIWNSVEDTLLLYLSSRFLKIVEDGIKKGQPDIEAICWTLAARLSCITCTAVVSWCRDYLRPILNTQLENHFQQRWMEAWLSTDLATSQDNSSRSTTGVDALPRALTEVIYFMTLIISICAQTVFSIRTFEAQNTGWMFSLLCVLQPITSTVLERSLFDKPYVLTATNQYYLRMKSLSSLIERDYKEEIISGNLSDYILKSFIHAKKGLGYVSDDAWAQYSLENSPWKRTLTELLGDLPLIYYAGNAILTPSRFSITSIAMLQQTLWTLRFTLEQIFHRAGSFRSHVQSIQEAYDLLNMTSKQPDGTVPYPAEEKKEEDGMGMSFEVRDLSFEYPQSKSTSNALKSVSFSIKSGQLVVIVGENGSGKSTIIKLLSRLYDATSGEILVDGRDIREYTLSDIRDATAILAQNHSIFPVDVKENIGLGFQSHVSDIDMITASAKQGGALKIIEKFQDGWDTTLQPVVTTSVYMQSSLNKDLLKYSQEVEKWADVSGGERQRLVASRTFMRLRSQKVAFVAVDEPSSALDPQGEFEMFNELRKAKGSRTMIFVTHRFGHLTKHADIILCMKDGSLVESGTHADLLSKDGEYARLYNIQAQAFNSNHDPQEHEDIGPL